MTQNLDDRLQDIFRAVLQLPPTRDVTAVRQLGEQTWDSLAHVTLVAALESEFGVNIDTADALEMTSYEATRLILEEKLP
jgi:acyl carrier protein